MALRSDRLDAVILNTAHHEFLKPDFAAWRAAGVGVVLDGRNVWSRENVEHAGMRYLGIGVAGDELSGPLEIPAVETLI